MTAGRAQVFELLKCLQEPMKVILSTMRKLAFAMNKYFEKHAGDAIKPNDLESRQETRIAL